MPFFIVPTTTGASKRTLPPPHHSPQGGVRREHPASASLFLSYFVNFLFARCSPGTAPSPPLPAPLRSARSARLSFVCPSAFLSWSDRISVPCLFMFAFRLCRACLVHLRDNVFFFFGTVAVAEALVAVVPPPLLPSSSCPLHCAKKKPFALSTYPLIQEQLCNERACGTHTHKLFPWPSLYEAPGCLRLRVGSPLVLGLQRWHGVGLAVLFGCHSSLLLPS